MRVFRVSAATGAGIEELKRALFELVPPEEVVPVAPADERGARRLPRLPAAARAPRVSRVPHRARLPRHRARRRRRDELEAILKARGRARRRRGRARRRGARVELTGALRRRVRPAARRARRASRARRRSSFDAERLIVSSRSARTQGRRTSRPRRGSSSRARRSPTTTCGSIRTHARSTCCAPSRSTIPLFVIGADQFCDFLVWKEPDAVLELARLAVATRPGFPRERLDAVLSRLEQPERVRLLRHRAESGRLARPARARRGRGAARPASSRMPSAS